MAECVFCKIVDGQIPSHVVYEDKDHVAFLDVNPSTKGQMLVIPKKHVGEYIMEMGMEEMCELFRVARKVAAGIDKALSPVRTCWIVEGFLVPHVHVKLYPCYSHRLEMGLMPRPEEHEFKEVAKKISECIK